MNKEQKRMRALRGWSSYRLKKKILRLEDELEEYKKDREKKLMKKEFKKEEIRGIEDALDAVQDDLKEEDNTSTREGSVNIVREN